MSLWRSRVGPAVLLLAGVAALSTPAQSTDPPNSGGAAIRRTPLTADELPAALAQVAQGTLVRMSPAEFELLAATPVPASARPRLVEARYRARFGSDEGEAHLVGTAEWSVRQAGSKEGVLALAGFQLPVRQARWSDGAEAVLFKSPADAHGSLYLPPGGDRSLNLEWSARGLPEPGEVRFALRLPAAPLATLELVLPTDLRPVLPQSEALLTGPFPADAGTQTWRIGCGGMTLLELVLRRSAEPLMPVFVRTNVVQRLAGTEGTARVEFQVESANAGFAELTIEHDASLTPTSVSVNNLATWAAEPGEGGTRRVVTRLREPTRSATFVLTGTFHIPWAPDRWTSPRAWIVGGIGRSERIRMTVGPAFRFRDWQPGGYRLVRAEVTGGLSYEVEVEPGPAPTGKDRPAAPSLIVGARADESGAVVQRAEWVVGRRTDTWTVRSEVTGRGAATALRFRLPDDWEVEDVRVGGQPAGWTVVGSGPRELLVDVPQPAPAAGGSEMVARMTRTRAAGTGQMPLPDLYPISRVSRSGWLDIRTGPGVEAVISDAVPVRPATALPGGDPGLGRALATEPLVGWLNFKPRFSVPRMEMESDVVVGPNEQVHARLSVVPDDGPVTELTLWTPVPVAEPWVWMDANGRRVADAVHEPGADVGSWLIGLGDPRTCALPIVVASRSRGRWWRIRLPQTVDRPTILTSAYRATAESDGLIPLAWAMGGPFRATVRVPSAIGDERLNLPGLPVNSRGPTRTLRYGPVDPSAAEAAEPAGARQGVEGLRLLTSVDARGNCRAEFSLRVRRWAQDVLAIELPDGATRPVVEVADRPAALLPEGPAGRTLRIPVPDSAEWTPVSVRYDLPRCECAVAAHFSSPAPTGPYEPERIRHDWYLSPTWEHASGSRGGEDFEYWMEATESADRRRPDRLPPGWQVLSGVDGTDLLLVRRDRVNLSAWAVALLLAVGATRMRPTRRRHALILVGILGSVLAVGLAPGLGASLARPLLISLTVAAAALLLARGTSGWSAFGPGPRSMALAKTSVAVVVLLAGTAWAMAQAGPRDEVFVVPGEDGRPTAILVPTALVEKLRAVPTVVVTAAELSGKRDGGVARFRARYRLYSFSAGPAVVKVPVAGIRVRAVTLDGGDPVDVQATSDGLRVPLTGSGHHLLDLDFTVPVVSAGPEREIKVPVPEVPVTALTFDLPPPGARLRVANWRGAAQVTPNAGGQRLKADLGAGPLVTVRWQEGADGKAATRVTAAGVWQVGAGSGLLTSAFDYRITGGTVSELHMTIPPGTEVYRLAARTETPAVGGPPALVRDWRVRPADGGGQVLTVEFLVPVSGRVVLNLDLVPGRPVGAGSVLEFPRPLQATEAEVYAAIASAGVDDVGVAEAVDLTETSAAAFGQNIWKGIDGTIFPTRLLQAYRITGLRPRLTLSIRPSVPAQSASETVTWWVQAGRMVGSGETRWSGAGLSHLEWTLPADVRVTEMTARNLLSWNQAGGRVRAWFERPATDPAVTWRAVRSMADSSTTFDVPVPAHPSARTDSVLTRVQALDGWVLQPPKTTSGAEQVAVQAPGEVAWRSAGGRSVNLRRAPADADARFRLHSDCRRAAGIVRIESTLDLKSLAPDRGHLLTVVLRASGGPEVQMTAPAPLSVVEGGPESGRRQWTVFVPPGATAERVTVTFSAPAPAAVPHLTVRLGPTADARLDQTIRLIGDGLELNDAFGLTSTGPAEWRVSGPAWRVLLSLDDREVESKAMPPGADEIAAKPSDRAEPARAGWPFVVALALWAVVAGLVAFRPQVTGPEQAAGLGAVAAITLGASGAALWIIPVVAAGRRARDLVRWVRNRPRSGGSGTGEFLN